MATNEQVSVLEQRIRTLEERLRRSIEPNRIKVAVPYIEANQGDELLVVGNLCVGVDTADRGADVRSASSPLMLSAPAVIRKPRSDTKQSRGKQRRRIERMIEMLKGHPEGMWVSDIHKMMGLPRGTGWYYTVKLQNTGLVGVEQKENPDAFHGSRLRNFVRLLDVDQTSPPVAKPQGERPTGLPESYQRILSVLDDYPGGIEAQRLAEAAYVNNKSIHYILLSLNKKRLLTLQNTKQGKRLTTVFPAQSAAAD